MWKEHYLYVMKEHLIVATTHLSVNANNNGNTVLDLNTFMGYILPVLSYHG